ncbi:MAG: hypothetical protein RR490_07170 [Niameybacter sp.]
MSERISRRTVKRWLNEWDNLVRGGPPTDDVITCNSGSRPIDGITNRQLNKIMLEMAYEALPLYLRKVAYWRWVQPKSLSYTLNHLQLTKDQYYYRCDKVVSFVYHFVNGDTDCL